MTPDDCRALPGDSALDKTAGPGCHLQDCSLFASRTPCPAVLTHPARDGRDYRTPGPWRPDGTVGNTETNTLERLGWSQLVGIYSSISSIINESTEEPTYHPTSSDSTPLRGAGTCLKDLHTPHTKFCEYKDPTFDSYRHRLVQ